MDYTYRNKYEYGSENKRYMHFSDVMRKYTVPSPRKSTTEDHDYEGLEEFSPNPLPKLDPTLNTTKAILKVEEPIQEKERIAKSASEAPTIRRSEATGSKAERCFDRLKGIRKKDAIKYILVPVVVLIVIVAVILAIVFTIRDKKKVDLTSYRGKSFVVGISRAMQHSSLFIVTSQKTTVNIYMPFLKKTEKVSTQGASTVTHIVDRRLFAESDSIDYKGVLITCSAPCMVFLAELDSSSTDISFILPETSLGTDYLVSGFTKNSEKEIMLIVATKNNTNIAVVKSGVERDRYVMNRLNVVYKEASSLSGSLISASAPISVVSGSTCPSIPTTGVKNCNLIFETLPPTSYCGTLVVFSFMYPRRDYTIGIVALLDFTDVEICNSRGSVNETFRLSKGDSTYRTYYDFYSGVLTSTKPVLVMQYGHGSDGHFGDPSMMVVPAVAHYGSGYEFNAIPGYVSSIGVAILSGYEDGLLLDEKRCVPEKTVLIQTRRHGSYVIVYVNVTDGYHTLSHLDTDVSFSGWLYGRTAFGEYATSLGLIS